jgi:hypothetical protein
LVRLSKQAGWAEWYDCSINTNRKVLSGNVDQDFAPKNAVNGRDLNFW